MYKPITYNERKIQLQITNLTVHGHDLVCSCNEPAFHSLKIITKQLQGELTKKQKEEIKTCLGITPTTADAGIKEENGDDDDFGEEIEKLFAQDQEDAATG